MAIIGLALYRPNYDGFENSNKQIEAIQKCPRVRQDVNVRVAGSLQLLHNMSRITISNKTTLQPYRIVKKWSKGGAIAE